MLGLALRLALANGILVDVTQTFKYAFMIGLWFFTLVICHKKGFPRGIAVPSAWSQSEHRWNEPEPNPQPEAEPPNQAQPGPALFQLTHRPMSMRINQLFV